MPVVVLASDKTNGSPLSADLAAIARAAWDVIVGRQDVTYLAQYVNPAIRDAELGQPEGALMGFVVGDFTYGGRDYAPTVADKLNELWRNGYLREPNGRRLAPWPGLDCIAWGGGGYVAVRWVKMFAWAAVLIVVILAFVFLYLISTITANRVGWTLYRYTEPPPEELCRDKTGISRWWCERSPLEKAALIGGSVMMLGLIVWFSMQKSVAEAAAPKITIVTGGETY